jgi:hypothetical protein
MRDVLSFDWGDTIIEVLDVRYGQYTPCRSTEMRVGAEMIVECAGTVVSLNGKSTASFQTAEAH